jgi:kinesin family member 3A
VVVRVRPIENNNVKNVVAVDKSNKSITVQKPNSPNEPAKVYFFDNVFNQESSQVSQFIKVVLKLIDYLQSFPWIEGEF